VSAISWIGTVQGFLLVSLCVIVGPLFDRGYFRQMIVLGSFLTVLGMMMLSLAEQYWEVFLAQALCTGLGTSFLFLPSVAIVATYFAKKRALAIGVVASGGSIGSVIYPIVFERLQPRVGFPWATRVIGFISLATLIISVALLRARLPPAKKARTLLDLPAFKSPPFTLFSIGLFLSFAGLYVPIFYIVSWAQEHAHIEATQSFYMLATLNGASVFGRIIPGILADRFGGLELMIVTCTIAGILAFVAIVIDNLGGVVVFAILYGFVSGALVSLPNAVVATLTPNMAMIGTWMGMSFCFAATGILIGNPIAGTIINVPENRFTGGFVFSGSLILAAAASFAAAKWSREAKNKE
jgi:MFS family permease